MTAAIEAEQLVRDYDKMRAVDHVSFQVDRGEVFGFLGPNGAGKTTTVRMLTTLLTPTAGTVKIGGYDVQRQSYQARLQMGLVPEESNVYIELSAWDNLLFSARLYRVPAGKREERAAEVLRTFDLYEKRQVRVQQYSKGMRRRLAIAMGLIHRPSILFLDEPTSGLDVQSAVTIKQVVRQLRMEGTTVFLTTHQMEDASDLCDRVAIINGGKLAAIDSPERLKRTMSSLQAVEVAFDSAQTDREPALRALPAVTDVVKRGDKWRLYTSDPPTVLPALFGFTREQGVRIITLNTLGPSLEDVFLHLTGKPVGTAPDGPNVEAGNAGRGKRGGNRNA